MFQLALNMISATTIQDAAKRYAPMIKKMMEETQVAVDRKKSFLATADVIEELVDKHDLGQFDHVMPVAIGVHPSNKYEAGDKAFGITWF